MPEQLVKETQEQLLTKRINIAFVNYYTAVNRFKKEENGKTRKAVEDTFSILSKLVLAASKKNPDIFAKSVTEQQGAYVQTLSEENKSKAYTILSQNKITIVPINIQRNETEGPELRKFRIALERNLIPSNSTEATNGKHVILWATDNEGTVAAISFLDYKPFEDPVFTQGYFEVLPVLPQLVHGRVYLLSKDKSTDLIAKAGLDIVPKRTVP